MRNPRYGTFAVQFKLSRKLKQQAWEGREEKERENEGWKYGTNSDFRRESDRSDNA